MTLHLESCINTLCSADGRATLLVNLLNKGEDIMTKITSFDLTPFYRNTVGIDRLFDRITSQIDSAAGNYPPYDIVRVAEDRYEIRVAAAGFRQGEIDVEFHEGKLTVYGKKDTDVQPEVEYLHHGISNRSWVRTFTLADYVEVKNAVMSDGILTIRISKAKSLYKKPERFSILSANDCRLVSFIAIYTII